MTIGNERKVRGRTVILFCTCKSPFQDTQNGRQKRVFNIGKENKAHCTVCSKEQTLP